MPHWCWFAFGHGWITEAIGIKIMTTNSETDTPRTDAEYWHKHNDGCCRDGCDVVPADFARQLERELNEARTQLNGWQKTFGTSQLSHAISIYERLLLNLEAETRAKLRVIGQCADLIQERDALKAVLQTARDGMMTQAREIERAWKECEEFRKDKARMDWAIWHPTTFQRMALNDDEANCESCEKSMRDAIDAAMKGNQ